MGRIALFVLGLLIVLAIHLVEGGYAVQLVHTGAALLCLLGPFLLGLVIYRGDLLRGLAAAFGADEPEAGGSERWIEVVSGLRMLCIAMGGLGFLVGVVFTVGNMDELSTLGASIALGLLSVLYAVVLSELCLAPLIDRLALRAIGEPEADQSPPAGTGMRAVVTDLLVLLVAASLGLLVAARAGNASDLVQPSAFAIILAFAPLNASFHGIRGHYHAFSAGYSPAETTAQRRAQHQLVLHSARTLLYALGSLGIAIGLIHILGALDDPSRVGKGLAVLMTAPLYAVAIAELFVSPRIRRLQAAGSLVETRLESVIEAANLGRAPLRQMVAVLAATMLLFCLCLQAVSSPATGTTGAAAEDSARGDDDSALRAAEGS